MKALGYTLQIVGTIVLIHVVVSLVSPIVDLRAFGMMPRSVEGIFGILSMHFLHANWSHVLSNTSALVVLLWLLFSTYHKDHCMKTIFYLMILDGLLTWMLGRGHAVHIGASGLVYALVSYCIFSGLKQRKFVLHMASVTFGFYFILKMFMDLNPISGMPAGISWEGHLFGFVAGIIVTVSEPCYYDMVEGGNDEIRPHRLSGG